MHEIELRGLDLNLLVVLDALLRHGGVTPAAGELGMSVSATSHALARLRDTFDDPLLVRHGNGMVATPRARALQTGLARLLADTRRLFATETAFDPARSTRGFCIAASDVLGALVAELARAVRDEAPGISLRLVPQSAADDDSLARGTVGLALQPLALAAPVWSSRVIGELDFVVVARSDHPFLVDPSPDGWQTADHVVVETGRSGRGFVGEAVERAGWSRRIALTVPSFLMALHAVSGTDLLFTGPRALVAPLCDPLELGTAPVPLRLPGVRVGAVWHPRNDADPAHRWLRRQVVDVLGAVVGAY